ncbi:RNA-splicing factor [Coemansia sp. RSA 1813]|nr:RNA-splicing factor [Coemansia sp. RSA 1813]
MGSGDLNMKKSWHPQTLANQRRVAEEKRKADEETKRAAKIQKELREERQREEMDQLNASVTHKSINKLEWMYNAPSTGIPQTSEDMEEYLLGKRDALSLLKEKDSRGSEGLTRKPEERWKEGLFAFSNRDANSERDAIAKTMEDPLADIKQLKGAIDTGTETDIMAKKKIANMVERTMADRLAESAHTNTRMIKETHEKNTIIEKENEVVDQLLQIVEERLCNENALLFQNKRR